MTSQKYNERNNTRNKAAPDIRDAEITIASLVACPLAGVGLALVPVLFDPMGCNKGWD